MRRGRYGAAEYQWSRVGPCYRCLYMVLAVGDSYGGYEQFHGDTKVRMVQEWRTLKSRKTLPVGIFYPSQPLCKTTGNESGGGFSVCYGLNTKRWLCLRISLPTSIGVGFELHHRYRPSLPSKAI